MVTTPRGATDEALVWQINGTEPTAARLSDALPHKATARKRVVVPIIVAASLSGVSSTAAIWNLTCMTEGARQP